MLEIIVFIILAVIVLRLLPYLLSLLGAVVVLIVILVAGYVLLRYVLPILFKGLVALIKMSSERYRQHQEEKERVRLEEEAIGLENERKASV